MLKKQTVNEDKIQKSKVQAEQSKPQGILGSIVFLLFFLFCWQQSASPLRSTFRN